MSHDLRRKRALRAFGKRLGLRTAATGDCALLDAALTHDSYAHEHAAAAAARAASNERLEFLGDAVLGLAVARAQFEEHPDDAEGMLSRRRAALVSREALAATARRIEVAPLLLLGKGEAAAGGERRPSILAGVIEALVGAIYLCEGFDAAARFVAREHLAFAADPASADPKTRLQEYAQARFKKPPTYAVTLESGPPHAKTFTIAVSVGESVMGIGTGPTKKQAQAQAAEAALRQLPAKSRPRRGNDRST